MSFTKTKKIALSSAVALAALFGSTQAVAHADPLNDIFTYNNPALDTARAVAKNTVWSLPHLTAEDKNYYSSAIDIAIDQDQINDYVNQAISANNFNASHPK